jgi:hypothetical protein
MNGKLEKFNGEKKKYESYNLHYFDSGVIFPLGTRS